MIPELPHITIHALVLYHKETESLSGTRAAMLSSWLTSAIVDLQTSLATDSNFGSVVRFSL